MDMSDLMIGGMMVASSRGVDKDCPTWEGLLMFHGT